ncbi:MAG: DUF397 domain-containing protein [Actinomycetota bacterium]|nr:DUF397 domain-containing protein [Actinomycetota bacterium]
MSEMHMKVDELAWRKSRRSGFQGNCVELADAGETIAVRNSRFPQGAVLAFPARDMASFLDAIKTGELDDLA